MSAQDMVFNFTTEDGTRKLTLDEYHADVEYTNLFGLQTTPPPGRQTVFLGADIFSFDNRSLENDKRNRLFEEAREMFRENPLKYYIPQTRTVQDFLNWRSGGLRNTFKILTAGNGAGKSCSGWIDILLEIIDCDPTWPIFTLHGVKHRVFNGPYEAGGIGVASYQLKNLENSIWPQVIKQWTPRAYISDYLNGKKRVNFRSNAKAEINGTTVFFYVMQQDQVAFESQALNTIWWDEQMEEAKFVGAKARTMRRAGRHTNTTTPHEIEGHPETGSGNLIRRVIEENLDIGLDWKQFKVDLSKVPDWIFRNDDKARVVAEWIDTPRRIGDRKKLAEGMARVYGEFHQSSMLVMDDFSPEIHVIPPFEIPDDWTLYRYHDHGRKEPNACVVIAVDPEGYYYVIREYYVRDQQISDNAEGIVAMCGNTRKQISGGAKPVFQEQMTGMKIVWTKSDPRSLSKTTDDSRETIQAVYARAGLRMMTGSGGLVKKQIPLLAELLKLDMTKDHPHTGEKGRPRLLVFSDCEHTIYEFLHWRLKKKRVLSGNSLTMVDEPVKEHDHIMTCLMLLAADSPRYIPQEKPVDRYQREDDYGEHEREIEHRCHLTGF